jgi:hypothetical protein
MVNMGDCGENDRGGRTVYGGINGFQGAIGMWRG